MPRFILIDSWLADVGGHNFQYALDVLQSAEAYGYEPVLAVNRSLSQCTRLPTCWNVLRLFHFGMCSHYWLGPDGRRRQPFDLDGNRLSDDENGNAALGLMARLKDGLARYDRRRRILDLARGCSELLDKIAPKLDDVLFLPSMSESDLVGVVRFLRDDPRSLAFIWHLQFHFNIFSGRDPEFASQGESLRRIQRHFRAALHQIPNHQLRFYATTEPMARQFDQIGIARFRTLPYPVRDLGDVHSKTHSDQDRSARPLRVTFAGAMRREKGRKQFGSLIQAVGHDCLATGQMQFVFQAKSRQVAGWLPRDLRNQIAIAPDDSTNESAHLRTVRHPLDAEAYHEFIRRTNIGLFLYDSRRYFARASGILGEMLAAGVPAIVPAGCWLADQIAPHLYRHVESLCMNGFAQDSRELNLQQGITEGQATYRLPHSASDLAVQFQSPREMSDGAFFEVTAEFDGADPADPCRTTQIIVGPITKSTAHDRYDASSHNFPPIGMIVPIARGARQVRLSLAWAYHHAPMPIDIIKVTALSPPEGHEHHPRSRVGLIFTSDRDVPELLREAHRHYQHYRQTAERFAPAWLESHHSDRTIEMLETTDLAVRSAAV